MSSASPFLSFFSLCALRALGALRRAVLMGGVSLIQAVVANAAPIPATHLADFAELEAAGAVIGKININPQNIFDLTDVAENKWFFQWVNRLHIPTRPMVIERVLLFKSGEPVSRRKIDETERLLRSSNTRYDVEIKPVGYQNGVVDIEVLTRDAWTLNLTGSYSRAGGENKTSFGIVEQNLFGTGIGIGYAQTSDLDRKGSEFELSVAQMLDGWTGVGFARGRFNDGKRTSLTIDRPFYALDTRFAARGDWREDDRIDAIYNAGNIVSEYRHRIRAAEVSGGWSPGLVEGWTKRYSAGALMRDDTYLGESGRIARFPLPVNNDSRALFARFELVEDGFVKVKNYNRIERAEYFLVGLNARAQLTVPQISMGSTRHDWLWAASVSNGYQFSSRQVLQVGASVERRVGSRGLPMTQIGASFKYYAPQPERSLLYASLAVDRIHGGGFADQLLIGGTFGLRGYPTRYQGGEQRLLVSIEKRAFTEWYPFRLLRIGGAVFIDSGRAWGGPNQNVINGGQLSDVGIGLRVALDRTAFANMLHADIAMPLNHAPGIRSVQFLLKSEFSF